MHISIGSPFHLSMYTVNIQAHTYERKVKKKTKTKINPKNLLDAIVSCREMIHREKRPEDLLAACAAASDQVCIMSRAAHIYPLVFMYTIFDAIDMMKCVLACAFPPSCSDLCVCCLNSHRFDVFDLKVARRHTIPPSARDYHVIIEHHSHVVTTGCWWCLSRVNNSLFDLFWLIFKWTVF